MHADALVSATAALCAAEPQPYAYVLQACPGTRSHKARYVDVGRAFPVARLVDRCWCFRAAAPPEAEGAHRAAQQITAGELPSAPASMLAEDFHTPAFGASLAHKGTAVFAALTPSLHLRFDQARLTAKALGFGRHPRLHPTLQACRQSCQISQRLQTFPGKLLLA